MKSTKTIRSILLLLWFSALTVPDAFTEEPKPSLASKSQSDTRMAIQHFETSIEPILVRCCIDCHGPENAEAQLRIDRLDPDFLTGSDAGHWREMSDKLSVGEMPPEDEPQPTLSERELIIAWVHGELERATIARRSTGGTSVMRRLTKYEYRNTLRDLLGVDIDFAKDLPPEQTAKEGFVNNNEVLNTSGLHVEYFHRIANNAIHKALASGEQPEHFVFEVKPHEKHIYGKNRAKKKDGKKVKFEYPKADTSCLIFGASFVDSDLLLMPSSSQISLKETSYEGGRIEILSKKIPKEGPLRITIRAKAVNVSEQAAPNLHVSLGYYGSGKGYAPNVVLAERDLSRPEFHDYVFESWAEKFPLEFFRNKPHQYVRVRNAFNPGTLALSKKDCPGIVIDSIRIEVNTFASWPPETRTRILGDRKQVAREIIHPFMARAYRRPASEAEIDRMMQVFGKLIEGDLGQEEALAQTLSAILTSSNFLHIVEPAPVEGASETRRPLNDYELATRLSYFLWSSMPDERLFRLAANKQLASPQVLRSEVDRMLSDPKSEAFFKNFVSQWFDLDGLDNVAVNTEVFPSFREEIKDDMIEETITFFASLVKDNRSCLELIDSEVTMLNAEMAKHYGIAGIAGNRFRPVRLTTDLKRGGVLTHASILTLNSSGYDTHPVKRGVWILERLLGDPPPPPPPGVPALDEGDESDEGLSLKDKMEIHRKQEACISCHRKIDPWGIAFENYDGIGQWRDSTVEIRGQVDPKTQLADGTQISDLEALKTYILVHKKDQFTKTVIRKLMSYALGRYLDFSDAETIEGIAAKFAEDDYRLRNVIKSIVLSEPFLTK